MWSPKSWQNYPIKQAINYPNQDAFNTAITTLSNKPPLVTAGEIDNLSQHMTQVALGKAFILQGGDCAESFADCNAEHITNKFKVMLNMSMILLYGLRKPVIRIGRIAGQYAKPRSNEFESINNKVLPCYRGDLINQKGFTKNERTPCPERMLEGYHFAATTLNYIRALINGGFSNLHTPEKWNIDFIKDSNHNQKYSSIISAISDALNFVETFDGLNRTRSQKVDDFFTSHEALHLPYETALTRKVNDKWYNLSTHFPWLGMRTTDLDKAHIEYMRGIENPIAIKIAPNTKAKFIKELVKKLNPDNKLGKLTLITRLGVKNVKSLLPTLIKSVQDTALNVIWSCDPMHGNTIQTSTNKKTRHFDDICHELETTLEYHHKYESQLGGIHLELTGENVTECLGGINHINENDLEKSFKSLIDPRLNYDQALEIAFQMSSQLN